MSEIRMNTGYTYKPYSELTFTDDFMFQKVLYNSEELCVKLIELLLDVEVDHIAYKDKEHAVKGTTDTRGVRFDVYLKDEIGTVFDLEMQNLSGIALPRRTRYYQSMIDIDSLLSGADYDELPDSYIVFICMFDPYGEGYHKYEFRELCLRDTSIELGSGASKVFINAKSEEAEMSEEMRSFLDYLCGRGAGSELTKDIDARVAFARDFKPWEAEYMQMNERLKRERLEGLKEGREQGLKEGIEQGSVIRGYGDVESIVTAGMSDIKRACELLGVDEAGYRAWKDNQH